MQIFKAVFVGDQERQSHPTNRDARRRRGCAAGRNVQPIAIKFGTEFRLNVSKN